MSDRPAIMHSPHSSRWSNSALISVLALAAALPYANTLLNGFVYDDMTQVMNNPYIVNFHHLRQIFSTGVWSYVGQQGVSNYYRPMMTLGYLLCYQLFGKVAFGYHLVNLLLHVGVVCILFGLTLAMFRKRNLAFATALIFALHPIHTESVAWIAAVTDLELAFFYLLAFWFFVNAARPQGRRSEWNLVGMSVCFILALLSKEQALTLPLLATLYEHAFREDRATTAWKEKVSRYGALWLLAGAYLLLRIQLLGAIAPVNQMPALTWPQAFLSAFALIGHYVEKMLWPVSLCAFYVFHKSVSLLDAKVLAGLAVMAAAVAIFVMLWRRNRMMAFGFLWFFVTLAPVLNARWMAANVFAERYLYLSSVGFCWLLGGCAITLWERVSPGRVPWQRSQEGRYRILQQARPAAWALAGGFAALAILCTARIITRNRIWNNNVRLYTRTLAQQPAAYQILNNLGTVYWAQGKDKAAEDVWRKALRLHPQNTIVLNNLGLACAKKKQFEEAADYFIRAMRLKPAYTDPHLNLGVTYAKMHLAAAAELQLRAATALAPLNVRAHNELGKLYLRTGRERLAEQQFRESTESDPNVTALDNLGQIYQQREERARAEKEYRRALSINPYDSVAHFGLGAIDVTMGRDLEAEREFKKGLETDPRNAQALTALRKLQSHDAYRKNPGL